MYVVSITNSLVVAMLLLVSPTGFVLEFVSVATLVALVWPTRVLVNNMPGERLIFSAMPVPLSVTMLGLLSASDGMFRLPAYLPTPALAVKVTPSVQLLPPGSEVREQKSPAAGIWKSGEGEMPTGPLGFEVVVATICPMVIGAPVLFVS